MQYIAIPVPEGRVQEVYELLARRSAPDSDADGSDDLTLVKRVTQEAPPPIRSLLSRLAERPDEAVAFADLSRELNVAPFKLRAEMAQFSARWKDKYRQDGRRWFFDVLTTEKGRVKYRMNARVAEAVLNAIGRKP